MAEPFDLDALKERAGALIDAARAAGADSADAVVAISGSRGVTIRDGAIEELENAEAAELGLRAFVGHRSALVSGSFADRPADLAERAVAMARVAPEDPYAGLAESERLSRHGDELDLVDDTDHSVDELVERAHAVERAMMHVPGVTKSGGASASMGTGGLVLATSSGFLDGYLRTSRSISATAIAGDGTRMERDYWARAATHDADLPTAHDIGRIAGERAVRRLEPQKIASQSQPIVFEPRAAAGFVGHLLSAINGASVARKTSFLRQRMGTAVLPAGVSVHDDPFRPRGRSSRPFDGEGIAGAPLALVADGILSAWTLDCASARELGLEPNGRARRGLGNPAPGTTNVTITPGAISPDELIRDIGTGLYVTDLIGQGVNLVTGDYSRGAAGYWIEGGEVTYPVSEITIAGKLDDMFRSMRLADDATEFFAITAPTIAVEGVTIGGR